MPPAPRYQVDDRSLLFPYYRRLLVDPVLPYLPSRLHPNVITHLGHLLCLGALLVVVVPGAREGWPMLASMLLLQGYVWCDNADGAHARRTGQTSTGGEYLDHGLDVVNCAYIGLIAAHAVGAGATETLVLASLIPAAAALTCWEQSITGVFRLEMLNQIEAVACLSLVLVVDAVIGVDMLTRVSLVGVTVQQAIIVGSVVPIVAGIGRGFVFVRAKGESLLPGLALLGLHGAVWTAYATGGISWTAAYGLVATSAVALGAQTLLARLRLETPGAVTAYLPAGAAVGVLVVAGTLRDAVPAASAFLALLAAAFVVRALRDAMEIVRRLDVLDRAAAGTLVEAVRDDPPSSRIA